MSACHQEYQHLDIAANNIRTVLSSKLRITSVLQHSACEIPFQESNSQAVLPTEMMSKISKGKKVPTSCEEDSGGLRIQIN